MKKMTEKFKPGDKVRIPHMDVPGSVYRGVGTVTQYVTVKADYIYGFTPHKYVEVYGIGDGSGGVNLSRWNEDQVELVRAAAEPLPKEPPEPTLPRAELLREAERLICGDRNNQYGPPTKDFQVIADMASAAGFRFEKGEGVSDLDPHHVALFQIILKVARIAWSPEKRDSWVDTAGYAGCGWECVDDNPTE